jgi:hypothetical protein
MRMWTGFIWLIRGAVESGREKKTFRFRKRRVLAELPKKGSVPRNYIFHLVTTSNYSACALTAETYL